MAIMNKENRVNVITEQSFYNNGFEYKSHSETNTTFICHCSYDKEHDISINRSNNKYQSFNNNCEQKNNPKEFIKKYLSNNNDYQTTPIKVPTKKEIKSNKKNIVINQSDLELISTFKINNEHQELFFNKRGFLASENYISITLDLIKSVKAVNFKLGKNLEYYYNKNYQLIILYKSTENKPFTLRLYSFYLAEAKKKTISGQLSSLYGFEKITENTEHIVFVEGEEKAEAGNKYINDNRIVFLSLPGITISKPVIDFVKNNPNLSYSVLFDNDNRILERNASYNLAREIKNLTNNVTLIDLPSHDGKIDLDSYLKPFEENERTEKLQLIVNERYTLSDYFDKHKLQTEFKRETKIKFKYDFTQNETSIKTITIDEVRKELPSEIQNHKSGIKIFNNPPGVGKTQAIINEIKNRKIVISEPNRILRNEVAEKAHIDAKISLSEHCDNTLNSHTDKLTKDEIQINRDIVSNLQNKGHNPYALYCQMKCKLVEICKSTTPRVKTSSSSETHAMTVKQKDFDKFDLVVFDESILSMVMALIIVDYAEINRMIDFYKNSTELNLILKILKAVTENNKIELSGLNLYNAIKLSAKALGLNYNDFVNVLMPENIEESKDRVTDFNKLPDKASLKALIFAIETNYRSVKLKYDSHTDKSYFVIDYKKDVNLDKPIINIDATANAELLKYIFPGQEIKIYNPNVEVKGIDFTLVPNRTFNASNLFPINQNMNTAEIVNLIKIIAGDKKALIITPKAIKEKLEVIFKGYDNLSFDYYGNNSRSTNIYKDKELIIVTPPSINTEAIIRYGKVLFNNIQTEFCYKFVPTGFIDPTTKKELLVKLIHFKDERLNLLLEQLREAEIYQALHRIKRDDTKKEFILLGNISLKRFNLVPNKILLTSEILNKDKKISNENKKNKYEHFNNFAVDFINEYLNNYPCFIKSDIYALQKYIINEVTESTINTVFAGITYNIVTLLEKQEKTANKDSVRTTAENIKSRRFYYLFNEAIKDLELLELNFNLPNQNYFKIIVKKDYDLKLVDKFIKEVVPPGPEINSEPENIIDNIPNVTENSKKEIIISDNVINIPIDNLKTVSTQINDRSNDIDDNFFTEIDNFIREFPTLDINIHSKTGEFIFTGSNYDIFNNKLINLLDNMASKNKYVDQDIFDFVEKKYIYAKDNNLIDQSHFLTAISQYLLFNKEYCNKIIQDRIDLVKINRDSIYNDNDTEFLKPNYNYKNSPAIIEAKKEVAYRNKNKEVLEKNTNIYTDKLISKNQMITDNLIENIRLWVKQAIDKEIYYKRNYILNHLTYFREQINNKVLKGIAVYKG